jgi:tetratricopeptide (TPR) repeat protein
MRKYFLLAAFAVVALLTIVERSNAQSAILDIPRDSQHAQVLQKIGITNININYHRPLVKGRKVWGSLVPYGQVWRAGANENTIIEFSDPVSIEGKPLAKGIYGLHMLPTENDWTVIFSKNSSSWGSYTYDQAEDALRVTVKPQPSEMHEALTYDFDSPTVNSTVVTMRWEKLAVPFKVEVATTDVVQQSLRNQLRSMAKYTWYGWDEAANYLADHKVGLEDALKYSDESIQVEERFDNLMTKARVLDLLNRKEQASAIRAKALPLGNVMQVHTYGRQLQQQGQADQAFEVFRANIKKNPEHWATHSEAARLACAKGDFPSAVKEMKLASAGAPQGLKPSMDVLVKRLENKEDINK